MLRFTPNNFFRGIQRIGGIKKRIQEKKNEWETGSKREINCKGKGKEKEKKREKKEKERKREGTDF